MERQRIQVYANTEIKRRVELAAAKHNMSVTEYCLAAIQQQLNDDELLEEAHVTIAVNPTLPARLGVKDSPVSSQGYFPPGLGAGQTV
ncbi:hypothetical protein FKZ61_018855 [Litorilinea aerophila]|uniref:Uncharacterized protein n=1 Tax=Litorilinea aerophila TaxID=1204385 RepID=A0A540VBA3_9CHLR|nr:hypothetical protein [Litorilinea aerophila]MCC9078163.1 hypothetical protein [Litorilinea aerophila]